MNPNNIDQNGPIPDTPYQPLTPPQTPPQASPVAPPDAPQQAPQPVVQNPAPAQPVQQPSAASPFFASAPAGAQTPHVEQSVAKKRFTLPPKKYLFIGGGVLAVLVLALLLIKFIPGLGGSASVTQTTGELLETSSFYAKEKSGERYALFDGKNEKKLTDYTITRATAFINKLSVVENESSEEGVMNDAGEMVIAYGKYKDIQPAGTLFEVKKEGEDNALLIDRNGKTVAIPNGATEWITLNSASYVTSPNFRPWQQYEARLHPVVAIKEGEEEKTVVLNFNGKEIFSTTESLTQINSRDSIYTIFRSSDKTFVVDSRAGKLVTELDKKSASLIPADDDTAVIPIGGTIGKPDTYVFIHNGTIKGELPGETCERISFETLPGDGSRVIFCHGPGRDHKLLNSDGTTIAEGSMFYTKDTYISHKDETVSFHKAGSVVATVKNCRSWVLLSGEEFTATAAYPIESTCDKSLRGVSYATYDTDGKLIKSGGDEWNLGTTQFTKEGLGIARKKVRIGSGDDSSQSYILNTALEVQAGPFTQGEFVASGGTTYFVSTYTRGKSAFVAYSGDLKTKLHESSAPFAIEEEKFSTAEINDNTSLYTPIESVIFAQIDGGAYAVFSPATKTTASATFANDADVHVFKWYIVAEGNEDSMTYYYRSGKLVE